VRPPGQSLGPRSSIVELTPEDKELLGIVGLVFDRELDRLLRAPLPGAALTQLAGTLGTLRRRSAAGAPSDGGLPAGPGGK
jgi:hypothetical protein